MLTRNFPFLRPDNLEADLPAKLYRLANDIAMLRQREQPYAGDLRAAPRLDKWTVVMTPLGLRLTGTVTGHPLLSDRSVMTSSIWVADPEARWVRSLSRYYRLGELSDLEAVREALRQRVEDEDSPGDD